MDRYLIISADGHAGADLLGYRPYLASRWHEEFDAWASNEAADRATKEIVEVEKRMAAEFEKKGKTVVRVDRKPFRDATVKLHNGPDATWPKDVYDKLQKL